MNPNTWSINIKWEPIISQASFWRLKIKQQTNKISHLHRAYVLFKECQQDVNIVTTEQIKFVTDGKCFGGK